MNIVILAAGQGKRMKSALPKVLQPLAGKPLLQHVLETALALVPKAQPLVVIGHGAQQVQTFLGHLADFDQRFNKVKTVLQKEQKGTGHALLQALPKLNPALPTLVLYGDVPLCSKETLNKLARLSDGAVGLLTHRMQNPFGYGRIVRDLDGNVQAIVEERDANSTIRSISEINTGIMVLPTKQLGKWLKGIKAKNAQGEYYLTDVIAMAVKAGVPVRSAQAIDDYEILGVNDRIQLAELERVLQRQIAQALLENGVTLFDPNRIDVRGELRCGKDVWIDVGCVFEGIVTLADQVRIGPYCVLKDTNIGEGTTIEAFSHLDGARIGPANRIGPYARIRPGAELASDVHIGNFVEVKNSKIASQSKANHLAYVGDSIVGSRVNIGAGTITCNYDGVNKHQTVIEDDVFIGSDTQLVAPVKVGKGATLGAGTTLTKDAPAGKLTVSRAKQISIEWQRPTKLKSASPKTKKIARK
ncbi:MULTISPECIES: bifunctional UDP-N-acetylglucosamine diphosphorylase/glucosamine-1-phosphate N-acetyltransferase GlmU [unclassified Polynucleobacter]|uniref:bifunctional UDP-N-acetylglucosamine diphosphorylase/glucosamine-1-phosphate N-acetyltransferase GlmU n=1 Tax=unclassified Polynucleobacter TaxID=2640945 RepID=UPI002572480F|nr:MULTISPECIES: bifunctional UDP-N-acetylglucosamine diphosphorylase/glucosamine-1-phosphate N-acetyltransferase GlmU [unclassified Polynucleobacter]BEI36190.1 bifunctional UDP-N-acetylglucosamine diphosphorylase/glucosamine-1-phosphate N-acetyltransferase GlmU [Polynucleobacter sp. HIN6]BEI37997.1 bifunctional UDP-N-acetylglucosamine diphosphorylase/glucosamine-1-phosphate N-acetyltransferase GlmU [Polynucleobacter sp. HIN7]BEI41789.1 bifunctional UDP-N-acetylglucosamine diphosphorylase/glucos